MCQFTKKIQAFYSMQIFIERGEWNKFVSSFEIMDFLTTFTKFIMYP